jgi:hypothetical protein
MKNKFTLEELAFQAMRDYCEWTSENSFNSGRPTSIYPHQVHDLIAQDLALKERAKTLENKLDWRTDLLEEFTEAATAALTDAVAKRYQKAEELLKQIEAGNWSHKERGES